MKENGSRLSWKALSCVKLTWPLPAQDRKNALAGIDILRKICNHPDLLQRKQWESTDKYGDPVRSGKLTVAMKVHPHSTLTALPECAQVHACDVCEGTVVVRHSEALWPGVCRRLSQ